MKKYISLLLVAMAILATSCKKGNVNGQEPLVAGEGQFLATIAENSVQNAPSFSGADNSTQAAFSGNDVMWQVDDEMLINGVTFTCSRSQNNQAIFGGPTESVSSPYHAFYPATITDVSGNTGSLPATMTFNADTNANLLPMYATSTTRTLTFHNICAALKITLPAGFTASKIEISNLDKAINGAFTVTDNVAVMHTANVTEAEKKITITGSFSGGEVIYAPMPAGTYTNFTVRMLDAQDNQTWIKIISTLTVEANKIYNVPIVEHDYLCFTALTAGSTVSFSGANMLEYSTDNGANWTTYNTAGQSIPLNAEGDKVYFRAHQNQDNLSYSTQGFFGSETAYGSFSGGGSLKVSGNIMYLLKADGSLTNFTNANSNAFNSLFKGMTTLSAASQLSLPATTLTNYCYQEMFNGCTSLAAAPALPATTLASTCYNSMFNGCTSLAAAPALPATTLAYACYEFMFYGCTSLTAAPALPATTLANCDCCYRKMFGDCTSLTAAPALPAETLANSCYNMMFDGCTSLTAAPVLPATTLVFGCYTYMFRGCSNLNSIEVGFTSWNSNATINWVDGVASSGTFKCPSGLLPITRDESHVPSGWTVTTY